MFFKKKGLPELNELVICTIVKVLPHAAFVVLDEYEDLEAMLHVSEISSRWVKNIRDVITLGKKEVCKVLNIKRETHQVDVSLKRVSNVEKTRKLNEEKISIRIEKLISSIAQKNKITESVALNEVGAALINEFGSLNDFYNYVKDNGIGVIQELPLSDFWKKELTEPIKEHFEAIKVSVQKEVELFSFSPDGINDLKSFFKSTNDFSKKENVDFNISYVSSPKYMLKVVSSNYKDAESSLKKITDFMCSLASKMKLCFSTGADK